MISGLVLTFIQLADLYDVAVEGVWESGWLFLRIKQFQGGC